MKRTKPKHAGGKPRYGREVREVYTVRLEPRIAARIRQYGEGSLAEGIHRLAERMARED
jgi:hypothetical protein